MNVRSLRPNASVENLKKQAKTLLKQIKENNPQAGARVQQYFAAGAPIGLKRVQLVIAREYGFDSWNKLVAAVKSRRTSTSTNCTVSDSEETLLECFRSRNVSGAQALLDEHPGIVPKTQIYEAHRVLRMFVDGNSGHCYKKPHLKIADLLIPILVKRFRDGVLADDVSAVKNMLRDDAKLIAAEFTAGRGIAQAIHHFSSVNMAEVLVAAGADLNARTSVHHIGDTPIGVHVRRGSAEAVEYLLKQGAEPNGGLLKFMASGDMPTLIPLLKAHGWDINEGNGARTLLHHDAAHGHGRKVCSLLDHGADANARDANGRTALHLLSERGAGAVAIRALVKAGASLAAKDKDGDTPLELARRAKQTSALRTLESLIGP